MHIKVNHLKCVCIDLITINCHLNREIFLSSINGSNKLEHNYVSVTQYYIRAQNYTKEALSRQSHKVLRFNVANM